MLRPVLLFLAGLLAAAEPFQLDLQRGHQAGIGGCILLSGTLLTTDGAEVCAWDPASRVLRWQASLDGLGVRALSADGRTLALGLGYHVILLSLSDGVRQRTVNAFWARTANGVRPVRVERVELSRDGRWIIACGGGIEPPEDQVDLDAWAQTSWYPVDGKLAKPLEAEPGPIGMDPRDLDDMEQPAFRVPGRLVGLDAQGRALIRLAGQEKAVPGPGGDGTATVTTAPSIPDGLGGGSAEVQEDGTRLTWNMPGQPSVTVAIPTVLPDQTAITQQGLSFVVREGLLLGFGSAVSAKDGVVGALWRWQLPACTALPVIAVPGTRSLMIAGDLLLAAMDPPARSGKSGAQLGILAWGPAATIVGAPQPFAHLPDFPPLTAVACDATSAWITVGQEARRFSLADGRDLPLIGGAPVVTPGMPFDEVASQIDQAAEPVRDLPPDASPEARQVLIATGIHPNALFQDRLGRPFAWAWIAGDGSFGWAANGSHLFLHRPALVKSEEGNRLQTRVLNLDGHAGSVTAAALTPDRRHLVTVGDDGIAAVWRLPAELWQPAAQGEAELLYRRITTASGGWLAMAPDGIYAGTRDAIDGVAARRGPEVFPVAQVELTHHRPDLLEARIGLSPPERIAALRRAWELRLRRLGLDPAHLVADAPPSAGFTTTPPLSTADDRLSVGVAASVQAGTIARMLVTVNGVPVPDRSGLGRGRSGVTVGDDGRSLRATLDLQLAHGLNIIEVAAADANGVEGPARRVVVNRSGAAAPRLVVCAVGVSHFANPAFDLHHAAGDAERAAQALAALPGFAQTEVHLLRDAEATRAGILALRERLAATAPDDLVVLFLAGHGVLDEQQDWWFLTRDGDPDHPATACVSFREAEGLLDGIPARHRLLLMDACHAGEVDAAGAAPAPGVKVRDIRGLKRVASSGSAEDAALMRDTFIDLRRAAGAVVIAASAGQEVAYEDARWQGGAFTRALLDALADPAADRDGDRALSAYEWRTAVAARVTALTGGLQRPVQRADNPLADLVLRRW